MQGAARLCKLGTSSAKRVPNVTGLLVCVQKSRVNAAPPLPALPKGVRPTLTGTCTRSCPPCAAPSSEAGLKTSRTEAAIKDLENELQNAGAAGPADDSNLQLAALQSEIDGAYAQFFSVGRVELGDSSSRVFEDVSEAEMQRLGREEPQVSLICLLL